MTFKKCRNEGCEVMIEVRNTAEGWRPYEESGNKHNCQYSEYAKKQRAAQQPNHNGNEDVGGQVDRRSFDEVAKTVQTPSYVDHTAKGDSKAKIFIHSQPNYVTQEYNNFLAANKDKIRTQGAHDHVTKQGDTIIFSIFLYYEEIADQ